MRVSTALVVTALFLERVVDGFYQALGRESPNGFGLLTTTFLAMSLCAWFWSYSHAHRIAWVMDMGWFTLAAWIFVLPYCIVRAEGRSGLARIGLFCVTALAAWATGWATLVWTQVLLGGK
jgi:hypothetical protein